MSECKGSGVPKYNIKSAVLRKAQNVRKLLRR